MQTTITATGLIAGTYTVTVTDAKGCQTTATANITAPSSAITFTATPTQILCYGGTGSVTLSASGGTGTLTYGPDPTTNLVSGLYHYTVTDANGCTATADARIGTAPSQIIFTATPTPALCYGGTGSVVLEFSGGTGMLTINPSPPTTGLVAGTYVYTGTDANGCIATATAIITQPEALTATLTSSVNILCFGASTGSAVITPSGGTGPYVITPAQTGLSAGLHTFTVTDAHNGTTTVSVTITQPAAALTAVITNQVNVLCFGGSTGSAVITPSGGTAPYVITPAQTGLAAGTHTFTVTDNHGCTTTIDVTITQPAAGLTAAITSQVNVLCFGGSTGSAVITPSGGTAPYVITPAQTGLAAGTHTFLSRQLQQQQALLPELIQ